MLKSFKYILLLFIVYFIWTKGSKLFETASPWDAFAQIPQFGDAISQYTIGLIFLVVIVIGAIFIERFFCRYLCPLGAVFAVISKFRAFDILKKKDECGNCRLCTNSCSMGIPMYKHDKIKSGECINCFKCIDACPRKNTKAEIYGGHVSPMVVTCVAIGGFTALYLGTNSVSKNITTASISQNTQHKASSNLEINSKSRNNNSISNNVIGVKNNNSNVTNLKKNSSDSPSNNESKNKNNNVSDINNNNVNSNVTNSNNNTSNSSSKSGSTSPSKSKSTDKLTNTDIDNSSNVNNSSTAIDNSSNVNSSSNNSVTNSNSSSTNNQQQKYKDGVYIGTGKGYKPGLQVAVTIKNDKIVDIQITSNNETPRFAEKAFAVVPNEIVQAQSIEVDGVSGATRSSNGIKEAVEEALSKAKM